MYTEQQSISGVFRNELKVKDLMTEDVFTLSPEDNLEMLAEMFKWKGIRHVPIVDETGNLVGLLTDRDLLKLSISVLARPDKDEETYLYRNIPVSKVMGKKIKTVSSNEPLRNAAELMLEKKYGCLPVVDNGKLVGILTESDFVLMVAND